MNDDDVLRRALHGPTEPISSHRALQDLRLPMRRARHRRRVAVGATAALLLVGGGAGVLAVTSAPGSPTTPTTAAPAPVAPPKPVGPTSQVLTSACGDVVVEFDERAVRITAIAALPGYTSQVATDGPESVEVKFLGAGGTCEVHAELEQSGIDVEIQNSDHDD